MKRVLPLLLFVLVACQPAVASKSSESNDLVRDFGYMAVGFITIAVIALVVRLVYEIYSFFPNSNIDTSHWLTISLGIFLVGVLFIKLSVWVGSMVTPLFGGK